MTPKEKAQELLSTYRYALSLPNAPLGENKGAVSKQCALIAVNEIISNRLRIPGIDKLYWRSVKQHIEQL
jgi:hypothetical protein